MVDLRVVKLAKMTVALKVDWKVGLMALKRADAKVERKVVNSANSKVGLTANWKVDLRALK